MTKGRASRNGSSSRQADPLTKDVGLWRGQSGAGAGSSVHCHGGREPGGRCDAKLYYGKDIEAILV